MRVSALRWFAPPTRPRPAPPFFGQERALKALEAAFRQGGHGYLVGPSGLGKRKRLLRYLTGRTFPKEELVYLPLGEEAFPLLLPEGEGRALLEEVEALLSEFTPALFREKGFLYAKSLVEARYQKEAEALLEALGEEAKSHGFVLEEGEESLRLSGQGPLPPELSARLEETVLAYVEARQKAQAEVAALRRSFAERFLSPRAERLKERFPEARAYVAGCWKPSSGPPLWKKSWRPQPSSPTSWWREGTGWSTSPTPSRKAFRPPGVRGPGRGPHHPPGPSPSRGVAPGHGRGAGPRGPPGVGAGELPPPQAGPGHRGGGAPHPQARGQGPPAQARSPQGPGLPGGPPGGHGLPGGG